MNALAEWHIITLLAQKDRTKDSFVTAQQAWLELLLPHDTFLFQKEWMNGTLKKPFTMRVQEFGNRLQVLNHLLDLFPQSGEDRNLTDSELKTILLNAMPLTWQQAYALKGTRATDTYKELVAYFTTYQALADNNNNNSKITIPTGQMLSLCGQNINHFRHVVTTPFQGRSSTVRYGDCCPQHPYNNHTWINCFCNPRNFKNRSNFHHNGSHPNFNNHVNSHRETRPSEFHGHNLMYHTSRNYRNEQGYKRPYYNPRLTRSTTPHTSLALVP